jgi:hypothetical protein
MSTTRVGSHHHHHHRHTFFARIARIHSIVASRHTFFARIYPALLLPVFLFTERHDEIPAQNLLAMIAPENVVSRRL